MTEIRSCGVIQGPARSHSEVRAPESVHFVHVIIIIELLDSFDSLLELDEINSFKKTFNKNF